MENVFDRVAYALRPLAGIFVALAFPVFLFSYGKMIVLAFEAWPGWIFCLALISHFLVWLGASLLHDQRQDRRRQEPR